MSFSGYFQSILLPALEEGKIIINKYTKFDGTDTKIKKNE